MKSLVAAAPLSALILLGASSPSVVSAEEIYKWTDAEGRVHYSNRGSAAAPEVPTPQPTPGGEGWESALDEQKGTDEFRQKVDAAVNSLELKLARKKRELSRAQSDLQGTQAEMTAETDKARQERRLPDLSAAQAREVVLQGDIHNLDSEVAAIRADIAKIRAMKSVGKDSRSP